MKPYQPDDNVQRRVRDIYEDVLGCKADQSWRDTPVSEPLLKYKLLTRCIKEFGHDIPSSCLMSVSTIDDIVEYFSTPVEGVSPYDSLIKSKNNLPQNIHAIPNYVRFHPETDTFFGGVSAYPGTSTIVTGLRAKKKYKGHVGRMSWPFV